MTFNDEKDLRSVIINSNLHALSKDNSTKVSASLFNDHGGLISIGYNGLPRHFDDRVEFSRNFDDLLRHYAEQLRQFFASEGNDTLRHFMQFMKLAFYKYDFFEHAERNLIYNHTKAEINTDNLFVVANRIHCLEDLRAIVSLGIKVIYTKSFFDNMIDKEFEKAKALAMLNDNDFEKAKPFLTKVYHAVASLYMLKQANVQVFKPTEKVERYAKSFNNMLKDFQKVGQNITDYCAVFKTDFSIISLGFNEPNGYLLKQADKPITGLSEKLKASLSLSAVLNCIYDIANRYLANRNLELFVSLYPCQHCFKAIMACGIERIYVSVDKKALSSLSNTLIYKKEFEKQVPLFEDLFRKGRLVIVD